MFPSILSSSTPLPFPSSPLPPPPLYLPITPQHPFQTHPPLVSNPILTEPFLPQKQTRVTTSYSLRPAIRPSKAEKLAAKEARRAKESTINSKSTNSTTSKTSTTPAASTTEEPPKDATAAAQKPPRGHLVLKTFDPHSGVCLKYKTSKAAEVGRLIQMLGQLGRRMAALPVDEAKEASAAQVQAQGGDVVMGDAAEEGTAAAGSGTATPAAGGASTPAATGAGGAGGGQGKKKKKGKR